jgi:hypothetical protein
MPRSLAYYTFRETELPIAEDYEADEANASVPETNDRLHAHTTHRLRGTMSSFSLRFQSEHLSVTARNTAAEDFILKGEYHQWRVSPGAFQRRR